LILETNTESHATVSVKAGQSQGSSVWRFGAAREHNPSLTPPQTIDEAAKRLDKAFAELDELFDSHGSAHRQFDTIALERLDYQPRIDVVIKAF
jgi:hypothetical protein